MNKSNLKRRIQMIKNKKIIIRLVVNNNINIILSKQFKYQALNISVCKLTMIYIKIIMKPQKKNKVNFKKNMVWQREFLIGLHLLILFA